MVKVSLLVSITQDAQCCVMRYAHMFHFRRGLMKPLLSKMIEHKLLDSSSLISSISTADRSKLSPMIDDTVRIGAEVARPL